MYLAHWGLNESPFRGGLNPRYFYESPVHEEALARLHFLADERRRLGLVLGDSGLGKSMILELFGRQLRADGHAVAYASLLGLGAVELTWQLAAQLGLNPGPAQSAARLWRGLCDRVAENRYQRLSTVLLLDDADEAGIDLLDQVVRLAHLDLHPDARLTIVAAARSRRTESLGARLLDLAELRTDLEPWEAADTAGYVTTVLDRAGRKSPLFGEPALERLHQLAGGVPRRVKQLADLALVVGAGQQLDQIDADTVEGAFQELGVIRVLVGN